MGEYTKNKEKLRILREKTAARRAAARAKKNAKKKTGGGRSRRKKNNNKKKTESAEEEKSEDGEEMSDNDKSEDDDNKGENSDNEGEGKDEENKSISGTQESDVEDPEETAQLALDLLSNAALGSYSIVSPTKGKSKEPSDDEAVELINPSEKEKEEKRPSMKVIVRRTFKK